MTVATLAVSASSPTSIDADVLVLGVRKTEDGPVLQAEGESFAALAAGLSAIGVTGAQDELVRVPASDISARSIALIGLGSDEADSNSLRYASGSAARQLGGVESIALALPITTEDELLAVLEGAAIGAYSFTGYRHSSLAGVKTPASSIIVLSTQEPGATVERATAVATAVHTVRDLANTPPVDLYPESFATEAATLSAELPLEVTVLDEAELEAGGYGGILGVGKGSSRGPRLVKVSYSPAGAIKHLALVGKGITFDSGGLSLKPSASMVGMKYDMSGAATVLAVVVAAARLALPIRLTAWLCLAENMPSGTAARPDDVFRIRGGKTVENLNTDAEGRLVLADGLVAASEENPDAIIDVATLTGAQVVALGNRYSAVMGDEALVSDVIDVAKRVGETLWPMPLPSELRALINSDVADLANVKPGNTAGGMLIGGIFLQEFIGKTGEGADARTIPWAHIDIAGPATNGGGGYGFTGKGATGTTVRTLLSLAEDFSRS